VGPAAPPSLTGFHDGEGRQLELDEVPAGDACLIAPPANARTGVSRHDGAAAERPAA